MNIKIKLFMILSTLALTGCGSCQRTYTGLTGEVTFKCIRGVSYIQSDSGLTLSVDRDGKPIACER